MNSPSEQEPTPPSFDEARQSLKRFIDGHFNNPGEHARASIPADPTRDDDLRLHAFIDWTERELSRLRAELEAKEASEPCLICGRPVVGYVPEFCCNGYECGCMGRPTNPCVCSLECEKALMDGIGISFEDRRIRAGIERYDEQIAKLRADLSARDASEAELRKELEDARTQLHSAVGNVFNIGTQRDSLRARLAAVEKQYKTASAIWGETTKIAYETGKERDDLKASLATVEKERDTMKTIAEKWQSVAKDHEREKAELRSRLVSTESVVEKMRAALSNTDKALGTLFWTSDDGSEMRDGTPDDDQAPPFIIKAWCDLRLALSLTPDQSLLESMRKEIEGLKADLAEAAAGWQPIETAPKDWSSLILYASDESLDLEVFEGYFSCFDGGRGEWVSRCGTTVHPTHWMPLPNPPLQAIRSAKPQGEAK